jgi:GNAT superfamily N-acetyltransferase
MPADWIVEALSTAHDRTTFDCGEPALDEYLSRYARQNQDSGVARTFVAVAPTAQARVLGYYSLVVGAIEKSNLPPTAAKRFPRFPLPIARLARLATDCGAQGRGLGEFLLMDALHRCVQVAEHVGLVAVLIDAKHERAKKFYLRYEFEALPDQPLTLWLPMTAVRALFRQG